MAMQPETWKPLCNEGQFPLVSINKSALPVYDVYLNIRSHVDLPFDTPAHEAEAWHYITNPDHVEIGTVPPGAKDTNSPSCVKGLAGAV
jgi:hypothetical protein